MYTLSKGVHSSIFISGRTSVCRNSRLFTMKLTAKIPQMRRKGHPFQAHFVYFSLFPTCQGDRRETKNRPLSPTPSPKTLPGGAFLTDTVFSCIIIITNITKFLNLDAFLFRKGFSMLDIRRQNGMRNQMKKTDHTGHCRACLCPGSDAERLFARNGHARSNGC